jgi:ribosomal protein S18 acetylase RimI-like enzyme
LAVLALLKHFFLFPSFFSSECFETELKWFEWPEREARRKRYRGMLQSSFVRRMETALETDTTNLSLMLLVEKNAKSIGFVQIGMLPPPPGFQGNVNSSNSIENEPVLWKGVPVNLPDPPGALDVPYIANLCVLPSCRRSGLGKKLVDVCIKWLAKRNIQDDKSNNLQNVFISVDADNLGAKRFYLGNGFNWIEPPTTDLAVGAVAKREYYYRPISSSRR